MSDKQLNSLDDSDYEVITEEMGSELYGTAAAILEVEDQRSIPAEVVGIIDETDREEIATEIKADQDIEAAVGEHEVEERLTRYEREIEDLGRKLAEKERQEETAWAVWGTVFLLLVCATIVSGILGSLFNDAFLVELALCLLLMVVVSLMFPEIVVRTSGVTMSRIWRRFFSRPSR